MPQGLGQELGKRFTRKSSRLRPYAPNNTSQLCSLVSIDLIPEDLPHFTRVPIKATLPTAFVNIDTDVRACHSAAIS
eukprot:1143338-Pelagomonas_calceolata.AAC.5